MAIDNALFLQEAIIGFLVKAEWKPSGIGGWTHYDYKQPIDGRDQTIVVTYLKAFELTQGWLFPDEPPKQEPEGDPPAA